MDQGIKAIDSQGHHEEQMFIPRQTLSHTHIQTDMQTRTHTDTHIHTLKNI